MSRSCPTRRAFWAASNSGRIKVCNYAAPKAVLSLSHVLSWLHESMTQTIAAKFLMGIFLGAQVLVIPSNSRQHWEWNPSKLTEKERRLFVPALQDATGIRNPDILATFSLFKVPLSRTGTLATIAISLRDCGAHRNCSFLVFQRSASAYVSILDSVAGDWTLKDARHHGYRDIVLTNYQGVSRMVSTWDFDGKRYRVSGCIEVTDGAQDEKPLKFCGS